jgi:hypothetical protein
VNRRRRRKLCTWKHGFLLAVAIAVMHLIASVLSFSKAIIELQYWNDQTDVSKNKEMIFLLSTFMVYSVIDQVTAHGLLYLAYKIATKRGELKRELQESTNSMNF